MKSLQGLLQFFNGYPSPLQDLEELTRLDPMSAPPHNNPSAPKKRETKKPKFKCERCQDTKVVAGDVIGAQPCPNCTGCF